jgi:cardiolipin synthase
MTIASAGRVAGVIGLLGLLAGCASVRDFDPATERTFAGAGPPEILGARGPLSAAQSKALLDRLGGGKPGDAGVLWRHLAIEQEVAESPLTAGNRTLLLRDGPAAFRAIFAAVTSARLQIDLEYFTLEDVMSDGRTLGDLLVAKRQSGVKVNVIYDSFGTSTTPSAFFDRLRAAGIAVVEFNPLNPLAAGAGFAPDHRDHRKILVVDGTVAIVGGVNLSTDYESSPHGSAPTTGAATWRDIDLQIEGPAVAQLQDLFRRHWMEQSGPALPEPPNAGISAAPGREVVRIIGSTPDHAIPRYYVTLLSAIRNAERSISVTAAYFVPTHQEREDLAAAARRGVAVRLLLPDQSDSARAIDVAHSYYGDLLEAGVRIYETHGVVLHAKTIVVDGVWSIVGSSNFDERSVLLNDEVDAVVLGVATARALEQVFDDEARSAVRIDPAEWARRPAGQKLRELLSRIWQSEL